MTMSTNSQSYNLNPNADHKYVPGHRSEHITAHEWRTAENSSAYLLPVLKEMVDAKPQLRLLDCGAGPGSISASLAKYIPQGEVVSTDLAPEVVERAAALAERKGVSNMKCQVASIYDLPYPDGSFDIVHVQQVLIHLDRPLEALRELIRVCRRDGGVIAIREADMHSWVTHPPIPSLSKFVELSNTSMRAAGGSPEMGVRLVSLALQAGVPRDRIRASMGAWCYSTPAEREMWGGQMRDRLKTGGMRVHALEKGFATEAEMDDMVRAWEEWIIAEDGCIGLMSGEILITL